MYIVCFFLFLIFFILIIPLKITIDYEYDLEEEQVEEKDLKKEIKIYILRFLCIKKIVKKKEEKSKEKEKKKLTLSNVKELYQAYRKIKNQDSLFFSQMYERLKRRIKFQKFWLEIEFHTQNMILNAYLMAFLNAYISKYIAKNANQFCLKNTRYQTNLSNKLLKIKLTSIINLNLIHTMYILIKVMIKIKKGGKKNGKETSNRRSHVNGYDFTRKYG